MKVISEKLSAFCTTMAIEDSVVSNRYFIIDHHVLNTSIGILHVLSLANVADNACIETLY